MSEQSSVDRLDLLYRISQTLNSSLDFGEVLNRVMDEVITATRAERGFLMLFDDDGNFTFHAARGLEQQTIQSPKFEVSRGVLQHVAESGEPLLTLDAQSDQWLSGRESVTILGLRSVLCVPLQMKGRTLGAIYVDNRVQVGAFSADDMELVTAIASSAVIALENARLYQVAVDKGRMEQELQVARDVQRSLIPRQTPQMPGWEFAALWLPAREVSGDFYDFIPVGDQLGVVIADVTDKGMPAALFMALARSTFRGSVVPLWRPFEIMTQANALICQDSSNGMFVSLFYAQLAPSGEVTYVNGGHNPPVLYFVQSDEMQEAERTGIVLGIVPDLEFTERQVTMSPGDFLVLYTDGVTEATNADMELFGKERLFGVLTAHRDDPAEVMLNAISEEIEAFVGETHQFDDVTMVVIRRV